MRDSWCNSGSAPVSADIFISSVPKNQEVLFHIRFHIMPNINITTIKPTLNLTKNPIYGKFWANYTCNI